MMKKLLSAVLVAALLMGLCAPALASVDLSSVRNNDLFYVKLEDSGHCFVGAADEKASYAYSDIIVSNYYGAAADRNAVWRWWLVYNAPAYLGVTSVTFTLNGTDYTFENVGGSDHLENHGSYVTENLCIVFGSENLQFWLDFLLTCEAESDKTVIMNWSMPAVLHGTRDVPVTINGFALLDLFLVGEAMLQITGVEGLMDTDGNPLTTAAAERPAAATVTEPATEAIETVTEVPAETADEPAPAVDYRTGEAFEAALNAGEDCVGKTVSFEVVGVKPDSALGFNPWGAAHLNIFSDEPLD